jgi:polyketide biosynthesis enoyl-CoA hydratase PksI
MATDPTGPVVTYERDDNGIGTLSMADEADRNTFSDTFVEAFLAALETATNDEALKVLLVRGLPDVFAAGADKASLMAIAHGTFHVKDLVVSEKLVNVPIPVIAAMEGHAVGGGLVLGLCCDIVLMAEESRYGANFMEMGFTPGMGCTRLLPTLVGPYIANELMFSGARLKGRHFAGRAQVNYVLPQSKIWAKATSIAKRIAEKPRESLEYLKYSVSLGKRQSLLESRVHEDFMHRLTFQTDEVRRRIAEIYPSE